MGICCTPSTSVAIARPVGAIHRAETMSGISFETGEGGGGVLLGGSGLGEGSLGLASLSGLLLGSSNLSVARLLSTAGSLCCTLVEGLGISRSRSGSLGLSIPEAVLLHSTSMDLLGGGGTAGLLRSLCSSHLSCALILHELLGGLGLGGFRGAEVSIQLTASAEEILLSLQLVGETEGAVETSSSARGSASVARAGIRVTISSVPVSHF